jgi:hypothetical protein
MASEQELQSIISKTLANAIPELISQLDARVDAKLSQVIPQIMARAKAEILPADANAASSSSNQFAARVSGPIPPAAIQALKPSKLANDEFLDNWIVLIDNYLVALGVPNDQQIFYVLLY